MTFPHSESGRQSINEAARQAIESRGQLGYVPDRETREMKEQKHTGIELTGVELAYLKKMAFDRVGSIENTIPLLERSLNEGTAPNQSNTEEELGNLKKELDFLQNNLAEKLFGETRDITKH